MRFWMCSAVCFGSCDERDLWKYKGWLLEPILDLAKCRFCLRKSARKPLLYSFCPLQLLALWDPVLLPYKSSPMKHRHQLPYRTRMSSWKFSCHWEHAWIYEVWILLPWSACILWKSCLLSKPVHLQIVKVDALWLLFEHSPSLQAAKFEFCIIWN